MSGEIGPEEGSSDETFYDIGGCSHLDRFHAGYRRGETYGSQKAASFKIAKQEVNTDDLEGAKNNLVIMDRHLEKSDMPQ